MICPSRWEGFGNVALEVKAIGTPLIVTSGSGFDDFCTDGVDCLMVPPADSSKLAAALQRLIESPRLGRALAERALAGIGDVRAGSRRGRDDRRGRPAARAPRRTLSSLRWSGR